MVERSSDRIKSLDKCGQSEPPTALTNQTIELNFVRDKLETLQGIILHDVQKHMSCMIDQVMQELRQHELQTKEFRNFAKLQMPHYKLSTWINRVHSSSEKIRTDKEKVATDDNQTEPATNDRFFNGSTPGITDYHVNKRKKKAPKDHQVLPEKIFTMRESFLTALLEVDHMKTIYHIFYIIFLVFLLNNISYEYLINGSISFGLGTFKKGFENVHYIAGVWMVQHIFVFAIYYALRGWSYIRCKLNMNKTLQHIWSISCLFIYIVSQLTFSYIPTRVCFELNLSFVTGCTLLMETVRLLMKVHSFVRSVIPRVAVGKLKSEKFVDSETQINFPTFNMYLYYLFAPTLIYRDNYPRTSTIRWKFALARFFEVVAVIFLYIYIYERHIKSHFGNFGKEELNAASVTIKLFSMLMPAIVIFLSGFYMILHAWLNFTAELLRFGDRMFYRDWWTATNYEAYYRNWNVVVHDWLYEYVYKDFYNYIFKGSKILSSLTVFIISALFHEYILGYALQILFPALFVFFGVIGVAMIFITRYTPKNLGNILLWFTLTYGNCILISLYSMEYFTRINCPKVLNSWTDYLVPHLWSCYNK